MVTHYNNSFYEFHIFIFTMNNNAVTNELLESLLKKQYKISFLDKNIALTSKNNSSMIMLCLGKTMHLTDLSLVKTMFAEDIKVIFNSCNIDYEFILVSESLESAISL